MLYGLVGAGCFILGSVIFFFMGIRYRKNIAEATIGSAEEQAEKILNDSKLDAERIKKDAVIQAKDEMMRRKDELETESKLRKKEIQDLENRINQRQDLVDKRAALIEEKENNITKRNEELNKKEKDLENAKQREIEALGKIAKMSVEEAKEQMMKDLKGDMTKEMADYIRQEEEKAKEEVDKKAKELLIGTIQRYSTDHTSEATVTTVALPNDDLKGRIIGREGRNIRTIEAITGVDLIIDDTPEAVVISSFDPLRREIARVTLETLIKDGRIHPTRIEELYDKVCKDMKQKIIEYGQNATFELGLTKFDPELIEIIGKLHFRTSFGQNALTHSIEVANLAGLLAGELHENVNIAKRAGLLHDIGKAIDHEVEGSHVDLGVELAKKYNAEIG